MRKERTKALVADLLPNSGQLGWLPNNPRQWTKEDIRKTKESLKRDPDFLEDRPILIVEDGNGKYIIFAGNLRYTSAKEIRMKELPAVLYIPENEEDKATIVRRSLLDNGSFGSWDMDILANEWDDLPLADFGVPVWDVKKELERGLTTEGREGNKEYDEFVDKFEQKLTTDDCYTPPAVYDAVLTFVNEIAPQTKAMKVERPFYPGGDYKTYKYSAESVVVDNPPFSILSQIVRFYCDKGIRFFLFAPALTLFSAPDKDVTYIVADAGIIYENGANVSTGFITNLVPDLRIWVSSRMTELIAEAQPEEDKTKKQFVYPDNIVTSAILGKIAKRRVELKIPKEACEYIRDSDAAKDEGRGLFGGGFILAERAAAERAAAERAAAERAAAERAARLKAEATRINISPREREIIKKLDKQYH